MPRSLDHTPGAESSHPEAGAVPALPPGHEPVLLPEPPTPRSFNPEPSPADLWTAINALNAEVEKLRLERRKMREHPHEESKKEKEPDEDEAEDKPDEKQDDQQDGEAPKPPLLERSRNWIRDHPLATVLILIGLVAAIIGGIFLWLYLQSYQSTDDAQIDGHLNRISSRVSGTVLRVGVQDTQHVTAGQLLIELDSRDYLTARAAAEANVAQAVAAEQAQNPNVPITQTAEATSVSVARLDVVSAEAGLAEAQQGYRSSQAELQQAEAQLTNAQAEEARYRALVEKQEVSREQYDQRVTAARSQAALVRARTASVQASLGVIEQRRAVVNQARNRALEADQNRPQHVAIQRSQLAARQAAVLAARAQLAQAALNLSYIRILAPVDGIVGNKSAEVGMQVAPGQELMAITPLNDLWVTANFKEDQTRAIHPGQSVTIYVDALDQDFDGVVENLAGATGARYSLLPPENATGNYVKVVQRLPVRIRFRDGQPNAQRLRPGMSVEPKVWLK